MTQWHLISESNIIQSRPILTDKKRIGEEENSDIIVNASMLSPDHDLVENKLSLPSASCKMIWKFIAISHYYESNKVCDYVFCCSLISSQAEASTPGDTTMMMMMMSSPTELSIPWDTITVYLEWRHPAGAHPISSGDSPVSSTVHVILLRYSNVPWSDCDPLSWLRTKTVSLVKDKMFRLSSGSSQGDI